MAKEDEFCIESLLSFWVYTEKLKHAYKFISQSLPDIQFYNNMRDIAKQLPDNLSKMLTANLHILYQNV